MLERAEAAFSDLHTPGAQKTEKHGLLARYAVEAELGAADESHSLELWSAHFDSTSGCMWVYYSREVYDADGKTIRGSWEIPSLWYLEKTSSGQWEIIGIKEHP